MPVMGHSYAEEDGKPQRVVPGGRQPRPGRGRGAQGRHPLARGAGARAAPTASASATSSPATTSWWPGARDNTLAPDAYQGANITLTNPGGIGTVASVPRLMPGQGTIVATGAIGYPPGLRRRRPERLQRAGRPEGHDDDQHLRPPRDPGRGVGRVPAPDRPAAAGRGRLLRRRVRRARPRRRRWPRAPTARPPSPPPSPCRRPPRPPRRAVADAALLQAVQAATSVVKAHRMHGHLAARLDPLGSSPSATPRSTPRR